MCENNEFTLNCDRCGCKIYESSIITVKWVNGKTMVLCSGRCLLAELVNLNFKNLVEVAKLNKENKIVQKYAHDHGADA